MTKAAYKTAVKSIPTKKFIEKLFVIILTTTEARNPQSITFAIC
tara:strand:+ start:27 stop:158 length:132 start_codon:yes stop_codon:yes gene_type:complete